MKKLFALALVVFGLAACQTEPEGLDVQMGGEQEVMLTVSLPETTRANSANGFDLNSLATTDYSLRYILEVYRVNDDAVLYDTCQRFVETSKNTSMVFPVRLAPGYDYRIVAWTDIVEGDSKEDRYYYTKEGLDNVVIKDNDTVNWNAMDETRDAYTYVKVVDNFSSASNLDMTLTRPFAKLRVVATDIDDIRKVGLEPTTATVEYAQPMFFKYNAVADIENKGTADDARAKSHTFTYTTTATQYVDNNGEYTLFTDYIFVPSTGTAKFNLTVNAAAGKIKENNFNTEIFVERNKLTTIKGDVLTVGGNVEVKVENELGQLETINYADNAKTLQEIINEAPAGEQTNITLGGDIDLGDLFSTGTLSTRATAATLPIVIPEGKVVVLDLNGHNITTPWENEAAQKHYYAFDNSGSLTIQDSKGNGQIIARGIFNYGTLTLESGTINACDGNGGYGVRNYEGAEFIMNGGSIVTSYEDGDIPGEGYDASPVRVDKGATATINGGAINNVSNYTVAIDNYGTTTINNGTFTTIHTTIANSALMTINGGSFTCNGLEGITAHALWAAAGTTTINGGTFDGKDNYNGFNVSASAGAEVNIYGGVFNHVHSGSLYGEGTINVMGGEFFDDPSARVVEGYKVVENNGRWAVVVDPAAKIGDVEYATLQEAFNVGGEITLLRNVAVVETVVLAEGKTATLDLNGFAISHSDIENKYALNNLGTLTITGNGTVNSRGIYNGYGNGGENVASAKLTIVNGTFNAKGTNGGAAVYNYGTVDVQGGEFTSIGGYSLNNQLGAEMTIADGVTANNGLYANGATVTIDGGEISGNRSGCHVIYAYNSAVTINGGTFYNNNSGNSTVMAAGSTKITYNGGTYGIKDGRVPGNDNTWTSCLLDSQNSAEVVVNNGTYNGGFRVQAGTSMTINGGSFNDCYGSKYNIYGTVTVKGGTYTDATAIAFAEKYVAEGCMAVDNGNNTSTVIMPAAKVGSTIYTSIDEAIAAWTNNSTLTLMSDVTLSDVVNLNSTEHHILDLGTYTMTAASGKNAFEIIAKGTGASERTAITIKADANNPGCINAGSKSVVYYNYANGTATGDDRPIIKIEGGIFYGGTSGYSTTAGIYFKGGSAARHAATLNISGGEFYCAINGQSKSKLLISGGLFHYSVGSQGDSTAHRLISGGTFKSFGFMTADSNNTKFWFGTSMGNSNVGLYINDDNYLVVGGPVITEFGDKFAAKATNATKWNSLLQYSSAASNGLYYTNADLAIENHKEANVMLK